jgi:glycosyltransferase involved in cell wall biosynthesis
MAVWAEENFLAPDRVRVAVLPPGAPLTHKRNVSICLSRGDIIAQADDDDISYPNRLDVLADAFVADSALMLCSADAVVINEDGKIIYDEEGKARLYRFPIRYHWQGQDRELGFHTTAVAYRREAAFAAGLYHPDWQEKGGGRLGKNGMRIGEDFDFYRRILERFGPDSARMLDKVLVQYRLHTGMLTALG